VNGVERLNILPEEAAKTELEKCCGSSRWVREMIDVRPFTGMDDLLTKAERVWAECGETDWLEAFQHHPKIGDVNSLRKKFASTATWASGEQAGVNSANEEILRGLAKGNDDYEKKNGFIFIVCATGKSAGEMLTLLNARLPNDRTAELKIAAAEQAKITSIRLKKLQDASF